MPSPTTGGGALTAWTVLRHLAENGHETTCFFLHDPVYYDPSSRQIRDRIEQVRALGVAVVPVESQSAMAVAGASRSTTARVRRLVRPPEMEIYPHLVDAPRVAAAVDEYGPDALFVYHFEALAASVGVRSAPRLAAVGDPSHLPTLYRWRAELPRPRALRAAIHLQARFRRQPRLEVAYLRGCEAYGAFAAHHAAWLREHGAGACEYLHTPVPDPLVDGAVLAPRPEQDDRPRFLLLGHLKGIATMDGLRVFARALPFLDRELGREGYDVRVVGGFDPPEELRRALDHPAVAFVGHDDEPADEIRSAHALVVPTSIPLGIRVRILTGFSYGCCVVSHRANAYGIPELADGENALLADGPASLAVAMVRAAQDDALRTRLDAGARHTYERYFAPSVAARRLESILCSVAARGH